MRHLDDLVFDVRRFRRAVIFRGERGCANQHIAHADLTSAVALAVITGKALDQHACKLGFAV